MANPTARIFVYRLTFESYLKGLNDEPSVESMKNLADELFDQIDEKLPFQEQRKKLAAWFDEIYPDLKLIEQEEQNAGKNKRHIKK